MKTFHCDVFFIWSLPCYKPFKLPPKNSKCLVLQKLHIWKVLVTNSKTYSKKCHTNDEIIWIKFNIERVKWSCWIPLKPNFFPMLHNLLKPWAGTCSRHATFAKLLNWHNFDKTSNNILGSAKMSPLWNSNLTNCSITLRAFANTQPNLVQISMQLRWVNCERLTLYIWLSVALKIDVACWLEWPRWLIL